jgi:hypothetical protein
MNEVVLDLTLHFPGKGWWWRDAAHLQAILAAARDRDLWLGFRFAGVQAARLTPFAAVDEVIAASTGWGARSYVLHTRQEGGLENAFEGSYLSFDLAGDKLALQLRCADAELAARRATLIDSLIAFIRQLHHAFSGVARIGLGTCVRTDLRYPSVRPPRVEERWTFGHLVDVYDPIYYAQETLLADDLGRLLTHPLPAGATRIEDDGLVILRWVDDLVDEEAVVRGRAAQERFVVEAVDPQIIGAYNAAGDRKVVARAAEACPPLTLYDSDTKIGYLALVIDVSDERRWMEASSWARAGALPDGTPLAAVRVIVPDRATARACHDRAAADGIDRVLYVDEQGAWWDPHPPGWWQS